MDSTREAWYLNQKLHYSYLISSVLFLLIVNFSNEASFLTYLLFAIHLGLLFWRVLFKTSFMRFFFKIRVRNQRLERTLSERTLKFGNSPINPRSRRVDYRDNSDGIEDILFGRSKNVVYSRNSETVNNMMRREDRQTFNSQRGREDGYYGRSNPRASSGENLYRENPNNGVYYERSRMYQNPQSNISPFDNINVSQDTVPKYSNYNLSRRQEQFIPQGDIPNSTNQFPHFKLSTLNRTGTQERKIDNSDQDYRRLMEQKSIKMQIFPLQKQFLRFNISKQVATDMILHVGRYFQQKIKEYKIREKEIFERLIVLIEKTTQKKYEFSNAESLVREAEDLVDRHSKKETFTFFRADEFISKYKEEIKNNLNDLYFEGAFRASSKLEQLKFYKIETERHILPKVSIQIISSQVAHHNPNLPQSIERVYYNAIKDFCFYYQTQDNHVYNLEESFLFILLNHRDDFSSSPLIRELFNIANTRHYQKY